MSKSPKPPHDFSILFSTTKAPVSLGDWQHLCFSINTQTKLWMFYKDGFMTDIGVADLSPFTPDARRADDNIIRLGRSSSDVSSDAVTKETRRVLGFN